MYILLMVHIVLHIKTELSLIHVDAHHQVYHLKLLQNPASCIHSGNFKEEILLLHLLHLKQTLQKKVEKSI